jgi:hypothetical protein
MAKRSRPMTAAAIRFLGHGPSSHTPKLPFWLTAADVAHTFE